MTTWRFTGHLNMTNKHIISERCVEYPRIHREIVTRFNQRGPIASSAKTYYFVADDPNEYATFEAALVAEGEETR